MTSPNLPGKASATTVAAGAAPVPEISVILLTYKHEQYIEAALQSILEQQQAPTHEILVAEDYSPDATRQVLNRMQLQFPGRFQILDRGRNLGLSANLEDAWTRCRGKYIVLLEGDDRWIDPRKLAKVYAAMEAHPGWAGCFHAIRQTNRLTHSIHKFLPVPFPSQPVTFRELLFKNVIPTYSCVSYRRGLVPHFPVWHRELVCGDWALNLLHAEHGDFGFLPDVMTLYLAHPSGMWSSMGDMNRWLQLLKFWDRVDAHYAGRYSAEIEQAKQQFLVECQNKLSELRKIEYRYRALQLHHVAAGVRVVKQAFQRLIGR